MTSLQVRYGELLNVFGRPAEYGGLRFMVAAVELEEQTGSTELYFRDHPEFRSANAIPNCYDVAYVRARIPILFGYTPEPSETEKTFLDEGFVCVAREGRGVLFRCTDYYGRSGLEFGARVPEEDRRQIAAVFWSLLLAQPGDVAEFESVVEQYGFAPRVTLGCRCGEVFAEED